MEAALYATLGLLVVATVSGLSILAIQYPKTFNTIYYVGTALVGIAMVTFMIYWVGVALGGKAVMEFVAPAKQEAAAAALQTTKPAWWSFLIMAVSNCLFLVLNFVSKRVEREKEEVERARKQAP